VYIIVHVQFAECARCLFKNHL